jgi:hypothetical protein
LLPGIRSRLTFANVISVIALFIALGGGAYALTVPKDSVKSKHIVDGQVKPVDTSGLVQGRGKLLASRFIMLRNAEPRTLVEIPGLGRLDARCQDNELPRILYTNTTNGDIDLWRDLPGSPDFRVMPAHDLIGVATAGGLDTATMALGFGDDPGARRTATIDVSAAPDSGTDPCKFQVQGVLWTNR